MDDLFEDILDIEKQKKLHHAKNEKSIDKNILDANIRLVDENKWLKQDNETLQKRFNAAIEFIEEWCTISENTGKCICYLNKERCTELYKLLKGE